MEIEMLVFICPVVGAVARPRDHVNRNNKKKRRQEQTSLAAVSGSPSAPDAGREKKMENDMPCPQSRLGTARPRTSPSPVHATTSIATTRNMDDRNEQTLPPCLRHRPRQTRAGKKRWKSTCLVPIPAWELRARARRCRQSTQSRQSQQPETSTTRTNKPCRRVRVTAHARLGPGKKDGNRDVLSPSRPGSCATRAKKLTKILGPRIRDPRPRRL